MLSPSPLAARSPAPIHRRPKTGHWPNRTPPAFPARSTPALATPTSARVSAPRGFSSPPAYVLHLVPGSAFPSCLFTRCHPISLRHLLRRFCSARYAHSCTVFSPPQGTPGLRRAYSHRIPLTELKWVSPTRRKDIPARLGGEPG